MLTTANLFQLLNEFVLLLLGALLILIGVTGRVGLPGRPTALVLLGILFLYWGLRAWLRREPPTVRLQTHIRAGSLTFVGLMILGISLLPLRHAGMFLGLAGGALVLRALLGAVFFFRQSQAINSSGS